MTPPRRYAKGKEKREEILRAALDLIAEQGYRASTLRELGTAVGLSNAGVLHYFDSKEDLYAEVLRLRDDEALRRQGSGDLLADFVDVIRSNADVPGLVHLYASLSAEAVEPDHGAHEFFVARYRQSREYLAALVLDRVESGELRPDIDPERFARMLLALADGLQIQWLIDPEFEMADDVAALLALALARTED